MPHESYVFSDLAERCSATILGFSEGCSCLLLPNSLKHSSPRKMPAGEALLYFYCFLFPALAVQSLTFTQKSFNTNLVQI
jgi:hypothetical protein